MYRNAAIVGPSHCHKQLAQKLVKFGQTDRHIHHNTSHPYRRRNGQ